MWRYLLISLAASTWVASAATNDSLRISVDATAGDILQHMATAPDCDRVVQALQPLRVQHLFLEGRRGDEYVPPTQLRKLRSYFEERGILCSGGIATVPGAQFGTRQNEALGWLNWESPKTRADISQFFTENAPVFRELIVDDFFCTSDTSSISERNRGNRSWGEYRRDLLVSLIDPIMSQPALSANPAVRLIIKFPQWYDRFHLFGYDPARMAPHFDQVWVGTEVRNPKTRRMGFVQPTEGYVNFRWISSIAGEKVVGAWFDHIECTPENFVDQAFQSVLAGSRDLTLFHLGDLMERHPGDARLASQISELFDLASKVRNRTRIGIPYYKPPGSDSDENLYLMDYLAALGLPVLPTAEYPKDAPAAIFGVQAGSDRDLLSKMQRQVERGGIVVLTPALLRKLGPGGSSFSGVEAAAKAIATASAQVTSSGRKIQLTTPLEMDGGLTNKSSHVEILTQVEQNKIPLLTFQQVGKGGVFVLNLRTFSEQDFQDGHEWLLAPALRGLTDLPTSLADDLRRALLRPLGRWLEGPSSVSLCLFEGASALHNFRDESVVVKIEDKPYSLAPHQCLWIDK